MLQEVLTSAASTQPRAAGDHQRSGGRQTEYQRPRFSSFHFGSSQSFLRSAADSFVSEDGTGVVLEEHAATTIARATIPVLISASPDPVGGRHPSVDAPFQARENVGIVAARGRMLSSVRPLMRQEDSRRPVWEFADWVQITRSVLEAQWKALVVPAPSRRLLRHTLLPLALTSS